LDDATVYLVPIGAGRFELYTEPPDDVAPAAGEGAWHRLVGRLHERWRQAAHTAHTPRGAGDPPGPLARGRDWLVRRVAESIAEQRTLWSLRGVMSASLVHPADVSAAAAAAVRERLLAHARRHHGWWLLLNIVGVAVTAILVLLPGPNLIGYYFAFRVVGHYLSWRGAGQALDRTSWRARPEPALTELAALAHRPRGERAGEVARLAAALHLPRLAAFFERVALPGR
jgi:Mitochondrial K+-H+ exchange-related